ncbi:MAG: hypothetical protein ABI693_01445 [Bryobacteraceae bacterium]
MNTSAIGSSNSATSADQPLSMDRMSMLEKRLGANVKLGRLSQDQADSFGQSLTDIMNTLKSSADVNGGNPPLQARVDANRAMNELSHQIHSTAHPTE